MSLSDHWGKITAGVVGALTIGSCSHGVYDNAQHKRQVEAGFRNEVMKNHTPHDIVVKTDGVTRQGFLNKGAAIETSSTSTNISTFIVGASPEAVCWYTTLRVTDGNQKLPFISRLFGGKVNEILFANQAFQDGSHKCFPVPNGGTMDSFGNNSTGVVASAPKVAP